MTELNYHHLQYFWAVAREGSVARASQRLHVAQPTVSTQLRTLQRALGRQLFQRVGRNLSLTDDGQIVYRYADEIFALGQELLDTLRGRPAHHLQLLVGVADVLPKLIAHRLLAPAFALPERLRVVCVEGTPAELLSRLSLHELDVVLSDAPIGPHVKIRAFNHLLGECPVSVLGSGTLHRRYAPGFPRSLDGAPFLLPTETTALRRALDFWMDNERIRPEIVGEFDDSALLKVFGQAGAGLFVVPSVVAPDIRQQIDMRELGRIESVREQFYAISMERRVKHPGVLAIAQSARAELFKLSGPTRTTPPTGRSRGRARRSRAAPRRSGS